MRSPILKLYPLALLVPLPACTPMTAADPPPSRASQIVCSSTGHGGDPVAQAEHDAVMALVSDDQVTHRIVASGDWDDPAIWLDQRMPTGPDANVALDAGLEVRLDTVETVALHTLRIDGRLYFEPTVDTQLRVDTVVVNTTGELDIGTPDAPIDAAHTATVSFTDSGEIDRTWDPYGFSRGLISHGIVQVQGREVTAFDAVTSTATTGTLTLTLESTPIGWNVGDRVVLTGTRPSEADDTEAFTIVGISSNVITLDQPLVYDHLTPEAGMHPYLAHLTRNVRFQSESTGIDRRGHVMFMHSDDVDVVGAGFYDLGRTDKSIPLNDAVVTDGQLQAGTGTNVRGRYSVHVHRAGLSNPAEPVVIRDCVVEDNPGWGFVNHSSNVLFEDNVSYRAHGAGFATEAGDELATFQHNLSLQTTGTGGQLEARKDLQDFGYEGWGFWFQGAGGLHVIDNVAAGHVQGGFIIYAAGLVQSGTETLFPAEYLEDPSWANGAESVDVAWAPLPEFIRNESFDTATGFYSIYLLLHAPHEQRSLVGDLTVWGLVDYGTAVYLPYTNQLTLEDSVLLGDSSVPVTRGVGGTNATGNIRLENVRLEGFSQGVWFPMAGENYVIGGQYQNCINFTIPTGEGHRLIELSGSIQMSPLSVGSGPFYDVEMEGNLSTYIYYFSDLFVPSRALLSTGPYAGSQLYFAEQAADFVPFPTGQADAHVPTGMLDKTNAQLQSEYGLMIHGAITPADAVADSSVDGMIGAPATFLPELTLLSAEQVYTSTGYQLTYLDAQGATVVDPQLETLEYGWNVITRVIDGLNRSFLVYNHEQAVPEETPTPTPEGAGTFELELTSDTVDESVGQVSYKVVRINGSSGQVSVTWATRAITATAGSDFVQQSAVLTFADGELEKTFTVTILDDAVHEALEELRVVLSNPTGGAAMTEEKRRVYVSIVDNDP